MSTFCWLIISLGSQLAIRLSLRKASTSSCPVVGLENVALSPACIHVIRVNTCYVRYGSMVAKLHLDVSKIFIKQKLI